MCSKVSCSISSIRGHHYWVIIKCSFREGLVVRPYKFNVFSNFLHRKKNIESKSVDKSVHNFVKINYNDK